MSAVEQPVAAGAEPTQNAENTEKKKPVRKPRQTWMLHAAADMASLGKFQSTDARYAALKTASRGHTRILLRRTNSKEIYEYTGAILDLDTPQIVKRADRTITYTRKPIVRFVRRWVYNGDIDEEEEATDVTELPKPPA